MFTLTGYLFVPTRKVIQYSVAFVYPHPTLSLYFPCRGEGVEGAATRRLCRVWTETAQNWDKSFTHIEHCAGAVGWEVWWTNSQSSLLKIYCLLSGFQSSILFIHFRYAPNTFSHCTNVWHYMTPHFRDQRLSASLSRYRNRAEITVPMREQKPYLVWFSCPRKSSLLQYERSLIMLTSA